MLDLYVLYACVHLSAGKHAPQSGKTRCVEAQVYFDVDACKRELAKSEELKKPRKHPRSWLECQQTRAASWIPADADDPGSRSYKAEASASDPRELAALLAPLSPQARATLASVDLGRPFQRGFQGPGNLSFFVVGTGSRLIAFAVTHLDDFQFADMATDVSSSGEGMAGEEAPDMQAIAENAGIELSYHTEILQRATPPPGGVAVQP
jgi:hypothetical protein